jgi:hypothetical protein
MNQANKHATPRSFLAATLFLVVVFCSIPTHAQVRPFFAVSKSDELVSMLLVNLLL